MTQSLQEYMDNKAGKEFPNTLDSCEEILEESRHNAEVSVVGTAVNHGSEGSPHGVCFPGATLHSTHIHVHQHDNDKNRLSRHEKASRIRGLAE
jgi:nicotinamide mononucleotide (NMN) deamidase PncC